MHPTELHLREAESELDVTWSDGSATIFSLAYLRGWCPCAVCQGHFAGTYTFHESPLSGPGAVRLLDVEPVGNYALRPRWNDGHTTGIYAFEYLKRIASEPPGDGPRNDELRERFRAERDA